MRFVALLLLLPLGCHDFSSSEPRDGPPENDALADSRMDSHTIAPGDLRLPDGCPIPTPTASKASNCHDVADWSCLPVCGDYARLACFSNKIFQREISCNSGGDCACRVGQGKPEPCPYMIDNGRSGCDRCKEAFLNGCCHPTE